MKKLRKKLWEKWVLVLFICIVTIAPVAVRAAENDQPKAVQAEYVYDDAGLLSAEEIRELDSQIAGFREETDWAVFAATAADAEGKTAAEYADDLYDALAEGGSDGILVLIDMDNRELYLSTAGSAIRYLTDERIERVLDAGYSYISEGDYAAGISAMLTKAGSYYETGISANQYNYDVETGAVSRYHSLTWMEIVLVFLLAGGFGTGVYVFVARSYTLKGGRYDYPYVKYGKVTLTAQEDRFLRAHTTHQRLDPDSGKGGGGNHNSGRSSVHTGSSGSSHGGGGRKF